MGKHEDIQSGLRQLRLQTSDRADAALIQAAIDHANAIHDCLHSTIAIRSWQFPLSERVCVDVKIHGEFNTEHIRAFTEIWTLVAKNYRREPSGDASVSATYQTSADSERKEGQEKP